MASLWIKMRSELWTHPKFIALSNMLVYSDEHIGMLEYTCGDNLGLDVFPPSNKSVTERALRCVTKRALRDVTMCALLRVWCAVNAHGKVDGENAVCSPMNTSDLDEIAGFDGFGEALVGVGWVQIDDDRDSVIFLKFLEHNELASEREQPKSNAERQRKWREKKHVEGGVTKVTKRNDTEDKRTEDYIDTPIGVSGPTSKPTQSRFTKPTLEQVREYCQSRKNSVDPQKFLDHYESNGWRVGKNPMKNWQASVRTWEQTQLGPAVKNSASQKQFPNYNPDKSPAVTDDEVPF